VLLWSLVVVLASTAAAAVASVAIHLWGSHRLETARSDFDRRWGDLARVAPAPPVAEHRNGARWLAAGGQAVVSTEDDLLLITELSGRPARTWSDAETSRARAVLDEQRAALTILLRTGVLDEFHLGIDGRRPSHEEIDFLSLVKGLRLLTLEARLAWAEGRTDDCLAAFGAVGRASDGLLQTPVVLSLTLGAAAQRWAAGAAKDLVQDPCADAGALDALRERLPATSSVHQGNITMAVSVAEIADEGLDYIEDLHDPSMGWSIPFWVSNHFLFEDLFVAEILERWNRHLALGQIPAASWPDDAAHAIWAVPAWPPGLALTGSFRPSLGAVWVRVQAAQTELQQVTVALDLRRAAAGALGPGACALVPPGPPTPLTGGPVVCRWDGARNGIVIEVPGAESVLTRHSAPDSDASRFEPIVLAAPAPGGCG
jgi:hypothetical protein